MLGEDRPYKEVDYKAPKEYRESIWKASFGLQKVDGLQASEYLQELAREEINDNISYKEIGDSLDRYYSLTDTDKTTEEADKVSLRIAEWISQPRPFELSTRRLEALHGYLFSGVEEFNYPVGEFRRVNISKEEPLLDGESVFYESWNMIDLAFKIDFEEEAKIDYKLLDADEKSRRAMKFIANIWQIHPFRENLLLDGRHDLKSMNLSIKK